MALNTKIRGNQIADAFFGNGLKRNGVDTNIMEVSVDDSTVELNTDALRVKDLGITTGKIANDAVDKTKINADVAGNGIVQNVDGSLELNPDNSSIEIASGEVLQVKALGITNAMLAGSIADTKLVEDYLKTGEIDNSTLEYSGGTAHIKDSGVSTAKIANDAVDKTKINADVAGNGIVQNVDGSLELNPDNSTIEIASGEVLQVKALGIDTAQLADEAVTEAKMDIYNAPETGKVLGYTANGLEWVTVTADSVIESDIQVENESANCDGNQTDFTLSNTPLTNSVQVFLNGLLQESGSGKDYTLSGSTISFAQAPLLGDILICHFVINN